MRRISIVLLSLICLTTIASAQNPLVNVTGAGGSGLVVTLVSADDIVARMMSFDSDRDGKVTVSELPERMQALVARGDSSGDGTLDNAEIAKLARTTSAQDARAFVTASGYTFGDQVGLSSRAHVEGAIEDLRLTGATKEKALDAARWFMDGLETDATAELLSEMKPLLTTEQMTSFRATLTKGGAATGNFTLVSASPNGGARTFVVQSGMEAQVARLSLPPVPRLRATLAMERFRSRLRPGDDERAALMEAMKGILSDEERDNLRAALERRPLVKSPGMVGAGFVDSVRRSGQTVGVGVVGASPRFEVVVAPPVPTR
jgi:hypothetical protein